jgi:cell division initiation protein
MKLTPLDIRKQEFTRTFRGYEVAEVQAFLQTVAEQWQSLLEEHRRQAERIRELEEKLAHYQHIEEALQQALQLARENARQTLEQAEHRAQLLLDEARAQADEIRWRAEQERHRLQQQLADLVERRDTLLARLKAWLNAELEVLCKFEAREQEMPALPLEAPESEVPAASEANPVQAAAASTEAPAEEQATPEAEPNVEASDVVEETSEVMVPRFATFQTQPSATEAAPEAPAEPPRAWKVRSIVGPPPQSTKEESPASEEEARQEKYEKLRRILKDLD